MEWKFGTSGAGPLLTEEAGESRAPRTLGRYVVLHTLHRSAAAEVYAAYDPELDRKVAIKLLSVEQRPGPVPELAQHCHPHLITVHDVGTCGPWVFIAMEFVSGGPLTTWLEQESHPFGEILRRFLEAGAGLVAAHGQGLAHRGFGADDVLLDGDGRVRVLGFYRPADTAAHVAAVGKDRHAFITELRRALSPATGDADEPVGWLAGVPVPVRRLLQQPALELRRGRPSHRGGLEALLRALRNKSRARWPRLMAACALVSGAALAGTLYYQNQATRCRGADRQIAQLVDQGRAQTIHRAFLQTGKPYAEDAFAGVQRALAAYLPRWVALYEQVCEDSRQQRQPEAVRDLRMACLEQQRARLDYLFTVFTTADEQVVQRAVSLIHERTDRANLEGCGDVAALRAQAPPPADVATAPALAAVRQDLLRSEALEHAGRFQEGLRLAAQTTARAALIPYRPIHAEAFYQEGRLRGSLGEYAAAEQLLLRAVWAAEASHHDRVAAQAWLHLFFLTSQRLQRIHEGHEYARHAAAALQRCTGCADLWAQWHDYMGQLVHVEGNLPEALSHYQEALSQRQKRLSLTSVELLRSYQNLGNLYGVMEQPEEALKLLQQALRIAEQEFGPEHPTVAACLFSLALDQHRLGQHEEALRSSERALRIYERAFGKAHFSVGDMLGTMGSILTELGRYKQAQEKLTQALAIAQNELGPQHPWVAQILDLLGEVALRQRRPDQARARFEAALAIRTKAMPPQHLDLVITLVGLSRALIGLDRAEQALPLVQRAMRICAANPPHAETLARARFALATVRWSRPATRREAHELADQARAAYAALGGGFRGEHAEVEHWLRDHPLPR